MTRSREVSKGATRVEFVYTATAGQTSFSGNDANSNSLAYTAGQIDVFLNGVRLAAADYTATNGTAVVLGVGAEAGDTLNINAFGTFSVADVIVDRLEFDYTATAGQTTFTGSDNDSQTMAYTAGRIDVYLNGSTLNVTDDYVATNGTSVVLQSGAQVGDSLHVVAHGTVNLASNILSGDLDLNGNELILDVDGDTTITADTDDQIDIKIAGADDFKFVANTFNILSGSTLAIDSGATIANSGTATGFGGGSVVKMSVDEVTAEANGSGVYSDTGLSVAITPASTDNKIMLLATGVIGLNAMAAFRFVQGSSAINQADTPGSNTSRIKASFKCTAPNLNGSQNFVGSTIIAASATSELTFKLQVQADATPSPGNWFLNRSFNLSNSNDASHAVATSYLYAIELTGGNVSIDT